MFQSRGGDRGGRGGPSSYDRPRSGYDNANFKPQKQLMETLAPEDFTDEMKTMLIDLHEGTAKMLIKAGVQELMPVQQFTYKMFVEGREIVVK